MTELDFPPLRDPGVAAPLAAFGVIACALAAIGAGVMLAGASDAGGLVAAMLLIGFVAPLGLFGVIFVGIALFMVFNRLSVTVDHTGIRTRRTLFGVPVSRRRIERSELESIEPEIVSRYQSFFAAEPVYVLVARDIRRRLRIVVAESLRGEAKMAEVRTRIERAAGLNAPMGAAAPSR